jgi:hypothetical protein
MTGLKGPILHLLLAMATSLAALALVAGCAPPPLASPTAVPAAVPLATATAETYIEPSITVCAAGCDFTTVQAAIDDAATAAGDVIAIGDPVHTEAGITVGKDVTIQGAGGGSTIVQAHVMPGEASDRVFFVPPGATVTIRDLTIRHGNPLSVPEAGGGVRNEGTLILERCVVSHNSAGGGGGLFNDGTLTAIGCTISDNEARRAGVQIMECSSGGGIRNLTGVVTLINSTVSNNIARSNGGGIFVACKGILKLTNSTISGNTGPRGGGIFVKGQAELVNGTISGNSGTNTAGGIYVEGSGETGVIRGLLSYTNTIIAGNSAGLPKYGVADCLIGNYAEIGANSHNLVGDGTCDAEFSGDPLLAPLADNGGPSGLPEGGDAGPPHSAPHAPQTQALSPSSPARDAIPADECVTATDQRGLSRPQGGGCDIGAFELQTD